MALINPQSFLWGCGGSKSMHATRNLQIVSARLSSTEGRAIEGHYGGQATVARFRSVVLGESVAVAARLPAIEGPPGRYSVTA